MAYPEGFIEEIKSRNPIEEVISQYAALKRAGSNMVCCCPFHSEKTPSFTVFLQSSSYYCFGCGAGGDVITFIMKIENLDYPSAIEYLANRAGISVPENTYSQARVDKKKFYEMNAKAARFFYNILISPEGKPCLDYLKERGLSNSVIKRFGIGYAPDSGNRLTAYLLKEGYSPKDIKEAFLGGISSRDGSVYDYFRNRAMFPIIDVSGNVVAFSGRFVGKLGENDRKYFNTNDTPVFMKRRTVFALNIAKNSPEKSLILCEGNMDAVSLHMAGISNAVASLGTALTPEQCRLISRYAETVYICYDSDEAGKRATHKAIKLLNEAGLKIKVITLSGDKAKDPDDFIREYGKAAFDRCVQNAKGYIEFLFDEIKAKYDLTKMDDKNAFIVECTKMLSKVDSPIEREIYIDAIHRETGINSSVIMQKVNSDTAENIGRDHSEAVQNQIKKMRGYGDRENPDKAKFLSKAVKEEGLVGILLLRPEYLLDKNIREKLDPDYIKCEFPKKAISKMLEMTEGGREFVFSEMNEFFSPDEISSLIAMRQKRAELGINSPAVLFEICKRLEDEKKKEELKAAPLTEEWLEALKKEKQRKE